MTTLIIGLIANKFCFRNIGCIETYVLELSFGELDWNFRKLDRFIVIDLYLIQCHDRVKYHTRWHDMT